MNSINNFEILNRLNYLEQQNNYLKNQNQSLISEINTIKTSLYGNSNGGG